MMLNIVLAGLVGILLQPHTFGFGNLTEVEAVHKQEETEPEAELNPVPADPVEPIKICLDPGHIVGTGSGNHVFFGATESEIVWVMASMLKVRLTELGYDVIKTRTDPYQDMTLPERSQMANEFDADLFLSLHCDLGGFSGYAFFVPDVPGINEDKTGPPEFVRLRSRELAEQLDREIMQVGPIESRGVKSEELTYAGGIQGALTISIYAEVPVMTLELGFLDNETDGPFLASAPGKILWVEALARAVNEVMRGR